MENYAIGDIHGCFNDLQRLLEKIRFDQAGDRLWFTGDLVNRGPESLKTLRYVRSLGSAAITVLGNHDLHLLALYYGLRPRGKDPTLEHLLNAPDIDELITWLQQQPILHTEDGFVLVHAGLHPDWTIDTARLLAAELDKAISRVHDKATLSTIYGSSDGAWQHAADTRQRLRYALNCFTRIRFCDDNGIPDYGVSCPPGQQAAGLHPWFEFSGRASKDADIIFGHWAALGRHQQKGIYALDSGCLWGGALTALRLSDRQYFSVDCSL